MKLEKGMLVSEGGWWFVVVNIRYTPKVNTLILECICDNANNVYGWAANEVKDYLNLKEIANLSYNWPERYEWNHEMRSREIPYEVITEVILGRHDDRFSKD